MPAARLRSLTSRGGAPAVVSGAGLLLVVVAWVVPQLYYGETPRLRVQAVQAAALLAGIAMQVAGAVMSAVRSRHRGGVPVVAVAIGTLYVALSANAGLHAYQQAAWWRAWYRADPSRATWEPSDDGAALLVRTAAGRWRVPADVCPGATRGPSDGYGSTVDDGVIEVTFGDDAPYSLRLHAHERRVTCPPPDALRH